MGKILSGCPVLEVLHLKDCWGLNCLNISSPSLATLLIEDWELYVREEDVFLEISAPYVLDLSIKDSKGGYEYKLRNVSSIVRAKLYFDSEDIDEHADPSPMDYMKELLESLQSVKELELGPWCVEVLSMLEVKGWQLPPSTRRCLTLNVWVHKRSIAGILGILKSSPNLERLVIKGTHFPHKETESEDLDAAYLQNANLDLVAFHVKTVKISSFTESFCSVEPMAKLVQLLLKGSTVLEKMVISAKELDIDKSARTLISFPRASSKAVIVFD
ncbi:hypothetical protein ACJIZ3_013954 [Penstemon smallii]|uniref:FBD domain-containing protein n=1 Tax=Penstemon smallii TaxID=265156 RepID=A0ABD3RLN2_9LAMI